MPMPSSMRSNPPQIHRVVADHLPGGAGPRKREIRLERKAGLDSGPRLIQPAKLCEAGGQQEIRSRTTSIRLNGPPKPRDSLLPVAKVESGPAGHVHPAESHAIARTQAKGLKNVSLCFFRAPDINLAPSNIGMGVGEIAIQLKRIFTFGDAQGGAFGLDVYKAQGRVRASVVRHQ